MADSGGGVEAQKTKNTSDFVSRTRRVRWEGKKKKLFRNSWKMQYRARVNSGSWLGQKKRKWARGVTEERNKGRRPTRQITGSRIPSNFRNLSHTHFPHRLGSGFGVWALKWTMNWHPVAVIFNLGDKLWSITAESQPGWMQENQRRLLAFLRCLLKCNISRNTYGGSGKWEHREDPKTD